jgi:hypothetical protein
LGNPFVSSINWENVTIPPEMTNEVHYIEAATGNDLSYVQGTGGTGSQYIPPMQGFFIKATAPGTFSAGDAARSHSGASNFYKAGTTELLILETSGDQYSDKMLIHFNELAGAEHDGKYDAYKRLSFSNPKLPQVFTYTPSGVRLSVNGMPETAAVPVGFTAGTTDSYSIKMVEPGNFTTVLLEDKMNGVITDLLKYDYSFNYIEGDNENRFLLHFAPLSVDETGKALANIYALDHTVYVNLIDFTQGDIFIYNVSGQLVATSPAAKGMNKVFLRNPGHYVVKVVTETETLVQKVFINQ